MGNVNLDVLKQKFEELFNENNKEQIFQKFIEENSCLIPHLFIQNHRIWLNTVFVKVPMGNGNRHKTDFMFLAKSSANWNCVLIEIEEPHKKIFNNDSSFTNTFNKAKEQVASWRSWLKEPNNSNTFKGFIEKTMHKGMKDNPINYKFVLIYGRSNEFTDDRRKKWDGLKTENPDTYYMTYDSLFEEEHDFLNVGRILSDIVEIDTLNKSFDPQYFVSFLLSEKFKLPKAEVEKMKEYCIQEQRKNKLGCEIIWSDTINAINKIQTKSR